MVTQDHRQWRRCRTTADGADAMTTSSVLSISRVQQGPYLFVSFTMLPICCFLHHATPPLGPVQVCSMQTVAGSRALLYTGTSH